MANTSVKKTAEWRSYKPTKGNDGAASKLELKIATKERPGKDGKVRTFREVQLFWVSAQQTGTDANGNASFGWEDVSKSVTLKLGEPDVGELLAVLNLKKKNTGSPSDSKFPGLFHQNEKGSTSFNLERTDKGFALRAAKKVGKDAAIAVKHSLTVGEAEILRVVLERAVITQYLW